MKKVVLDDYLKKWPKDLVEKCKQDKKDKYKQMYPKRNVIPAVITGWTPEKEFIKEKVKENYTIKDFERLFPDDFIQSERLVHQKDLLGYCIESPMGLFDYIPARSIDSAKDAASDETRTDKGKLVDCIIEEIKYSMTKSGNEMARTSIMDGKGSSTLILWDSQIADSAIKEIIKTNPGRTIGIRAKMVYNKDRDSFVLSRGAEITYLKYKDEKTNEVEV